MRQKDVKDVRHTRVMPSDNAKLDSELAPLKDLKNVLQKTTAEVVGFSAKKKQDWFDENDTETQ